jgi:TATA-box binding protein (TBP) (component of TFIID and TFIIIB)
MCRLTQPELQNLVVFFKLPSSVEKKKLLNISPAINFAENPRNFYVFRLDLHTGELKERKKHKGQQKGVKKGLSFTVFPKSGSVIATGLNSHLQIEPALKHFAHFINTSGSANWKKTIVNSTYAGKTICCDGEIISMYRIFFSAKKELDDVKTLSLSFRSHFFPGILIKWNEIKGSVNVFDNGCYVIVGTDGSQHQVNSIYAQLCALIRTYWTTSTPAISCAWTAIKSSTEYTDISEEVNTVDKTKS